MSVYAGESYAKRMARAIVYTEMVDAQFWKQQARDQSFLITLTGDEAAEAGLFWSMGIHMRQCVFVDMKDKNTETARRVAPDSIAVTADVVNVLRAFPGSIGLVHLDFMGGYTETTREALEACALKVRPGGYVIWTFLRGRETEANAYWALAKQMVRSADALKLEPDAWLTRKHGYMSLVQGELNRNLDMRGPVFIPAGSLDYDSGRSPMGMMVFKKAHAAERKTKRRAFMHGGSKRAQMRAIGEVLPDITLRGDAKAAVRRKVCCPCCYRKLPARALAGLFNLPEGTIRAWRAHDTMGTYRDDDSRFWMIKQKRYWVPCPECATAAKAESMGIPLNQVAISCASRKEKILANASRNKYTRRGRAAWQLEQQK